MLWVGGAEMAEDSATISETVSYLETNGRPETFDIDETDPNVADWTRRGLIGVR